MVLDIPVSKIIADVGHDGSDIMWPQLPEPRCRRAFHIQELIQVSYDLGYLVTPFEAVPLLTAGDGIIDIQFKEAPKQRFQRIMRGNYGVITGATPQGSPHAVAWNGDVIFDTNEKIYPISNFVLDTFWMLSHDTKTKIRHSECNRT